MTMCVDMTYKNIYTSRICEYVRHDSRDMTHETCLTRHDSRMHIHTVYLSNAYETSRTNEGDMTHK